jgi:predicted RNA binding protein YcfA (HicA-like mRNA interferase family)
LKGREVAAILERLGSHRQYRHPDGRGTTVPFHAGRDISALILRQIAKDIGLTMNEFLAHR